MECFAFKIVQEKSCKINFIVDNSQTLAKVNTRAHSKRSRMAINRNVKHLPWKCFSYATALGLGNREKKKEQNKWLSESEVYDQNLERSMHARNLKLNTEPLPLLRPTTTHYEITRWGRKERKQKSICNIKHKHSLLFFDCMVGCCLCIFVAVSDGSQVILSGNRSIPYSRVLQLERGCLERRTRCLLKQSFMDINHRTVYIRTCVLRLKEVASAWHAL